MQFRHPRAVVLLFIGIIVVVLSAFWMRPVRTGLVVWLVVGSVDRPVN